MIKKILPIVLFLFFSSIQAGEFEITVDVNDIDALPAALTRGANEAYAFNLKGLDELKIGNLDVALDFFKKASAKIPNYSDAENNIAVVYWKKGIVGSAEKVWTALLKKDSKYTIAWYNMAIVANSENDNDLAISHLSNAIANNPRFMDAYILLARLQMEMNENKNALRTLKNAYEIDNKNILVWQNLAYVSVLVGDTNSAEKILSEHLDNGDALRMLGEIYAVRGERTVALDYLKEAHSRGVDISILLEMAQLQLDEGRPCEAFESTEMYLEGGRKGTANSYNVGGIAARECGEKKRAEEIFLEGIRFYPNDDLIRMNTGAYLFHKAKYRQAYEILSELQDTVSDPSIQNMKVLSLVRLNQTEKALIEVKSAIKKNPFSSELNDIYGTLLYKKGLKADAKKCFKKALKLNPSNKSAKVNFSLVNGENGNLDLNDVIMDYNLRIDTCEVSCIPLKHTLSRFYALTGNLRRAIGLLNQIDHRDKTLKTYTLLSNYFNEIGRTADAIGELEDALDRFDIKDEVMFSLAVAYINIGSYTKGIKLLHEIKNGDIVEPKKVNYQLGYAYMKLGNYMQAAVAFEKNIKIKNSRYEVYSFLGFIYNQLGDMKNAKKNWERSIKSNPSDPVVWINMGILLQQEKKYKAALSKYEKALTLSGVDKGVYINIGSVYERLGFKVEAKNAYKSAISSDEKIKALYNLFLMAMDAEDKSEMKKYISKLSAIPNSPVEAKRASGEYALFVKNYPEAERLFVSIKKKNTEDFVALAKIYKNLRKTDKMNEVLTKLPNDAKWKRFKRELGTELAFNNGNFDKVYNLLKSENDSTFTGKINLAVASYEVGKLEEALSVALPLLENAEGDDRAKLFLLIGNISLMQKKWSDAEMWFSALSDMNRGDAKPLYNIAVAAYNLDKTKKAFEYYQKARKLDPSIKNSDIENKYKYITNKEKILKEDSVIFEKYDELYNSAVELQQAGNAEEARKIYKKIVDDEGRYYRAWNNLGAIYGAEGDIDNAIECYENAVSRRADIIDGYANLVNIYIVLEDRINAEKWLKKGFKREPLNALLKQLETQLEQLH